MSMNRVVTVFVAAVIICVAGCATYYVPPAEGEPQATIRGQYSNPLTSIYCTDVYFFKLDDQIPRYRFAFPWVSIPISPGPHVAKLSGRYGLLSIYYLNPVAGLFPCSLGCSATLQFTAEPSHAYELALIKEGDPYFIDLIDLETNKPVASAPCYSAFSKREQSTAPEPDTRPGFIEAPH